MRSSRSPPMLAYTHKLESTQFSQGTSRTIDHETEIQALRPPFPPAWSLNRGSDHLTSTPRHCCSHFLPPSVPPPASPARNSPPLDMAKAPRLPLDITTRPTPLSKKKFAASVTSVQRDIFNASSLRKAPRQSFEGGVRIDYYYFCR